ncbi:hypothetical protein [Pseudomonas phage Nerthus]|uniref:Uncharacterized protein n=1 Tax=Pseudomonas phage Nerthus TaxID=2163984 RepID=A0A2S1GMM6_9CAUD|nr:hypothetical protein HOT09_gp09 [Pseudomonas phage Nerthus]AWD90641.1 hypothetical protein [Pseudomonas phage Nerthus]
MNRVDEKFARKKRKITREETRKDMNAAARKLKRVGWQSVEKHA